MPRRLQVAAIVVIAVSLVAACGGDPTESDEYAAVAAERDAVTSERDALDTALEESLDRIGDLEAAIAELEDAAAEAVAEFEVLQAEADAGVEQNEALQARLDDMGAQIAQLAADKAALIQERDAAVTTAEGLTAAVEAGLGSELKQAWDAEVERACAVSIENWDIPVGNQVRYDAEWNILGRKQDLIDDVQECAAEGRQAAAEAAGADGPVDEQKPPPITGPAPKWE